MPRTTLHADLEYHFGLAKQTWCFAYEVFPVLGALELAPEGFTTLDKDITSQGRLFRSRANALPTDLPFSVGVPNNALEATLLFDGGVINASSVAMGKYDGARLNIYALNYSGDLDIRERLFGGFLGKADYGTEAATFELSPNSVVLNRDLGGRYVRSCSHPRYGRGFCRNGEDVDGLDDGPDIADFTRTGTVGTVTSAGNFRISGITAEQAPDNWADYGVLRFTSGPLSGAEYDVVRWLAAAGGDLGQVWLNVPAHLQPSPGDSVALERGCDRTWEACLARANTPNYGGFAHFPGSDGMSRYKDEN
jgi:uncharacterized phage protein (TIGR02218 family)